MANEIKKTVIVDAPPAAVFRALTDEKELVQWFPQQAKMDARVGGRYEFKYSWAERNLQAAATGEILELVPDKRLSYTFNSTRGSTDSVVTWTLEELPSGKTLVMLVHAGIAEGRLGDSGAGWEHFTTQLVAYCAKMAAASVR
jgi:uncharacterized protein YndB with AHSA1/START domain